MRKALYRTAICLALVSLLFPVGHEQSGGLPAPPIAEAAPADVLPRLDVRWGFYVTYHPSSWASLQANVSRLNYVSPWFYNVDKEGKVVGKDQPHVTSLLKKQGVKSLPMVQNLAQYNDFTPILADTNKVFSIISSIDLLVTQHNYDGITIDFEWLNAADKPHLTAFMQRLYDTLHPKGKLVAIAVPVKVKDDQTGWAGAYDYAALEKVTDYILVMGYDFSWSGSDPGPVAPIGRLRNTLRYTLSRVPPKKIIWGIGVYGYDWYKNQLAPTPTIPVTPDPAAPTSTPTPTATPTPTPKPSATPVAGNGKPKADYRSYSDAMERTRLPEAEAGYDESVQAPWVRYKQNGWEREIWYEDARSFRAKLNLVVESKVAGFGIWRIGQEDPKVWEEIARVGPPWACAPVKPVQSSPERVYFPETGHTLKGRFLQYWSENGGLPVFGYPLTEAFDEISPTDGKLYRVQYFERNRFEYHPSKPPPHNIQLGLLGVQALGNRTLPPSPDPVPDPATVYFPQVKRSLGGPFLNYWQERGGLIRFGYPISDPVVEQSPTDGKLYRVQYTERARMEHHPEHTGTEHEVQLGLLGLYVLPCR